MTFPTLFASKRCLFFIVYCFVKVYVHKPENIHSFIFNGSGNIFNCKIMRLNYSLFQSTELRLAIHNLASFSVVVFLLKFFHEIKVNIPKILTKYRCDMQVFPINGVKRTSSNSRDTIHVKSCLAIYLPELSLPFCVYVCLLSILVVINFFLIT